MTKDRKDKTIAALLAFFGGTFGIHRFYLGNIKQGLMHLLFFWTGIPYIVSLVDTVGFLTMSQDNFDRKYNGYLVPEGGFNSSNQVYIADELHKLDLLFKRGVITFEEFERRKAKLMS
ncbi:MAG: NINE protein [Bacteroidia bacterium]|nr:NINE protein [Bacteroidia bacterium]